LTLAV
jgi:calcium/calmodulin-dependent protein kinase I